MLQARDRREVHIMVDNLKDKDHLEDLGTYGRIILKLILKDRMVRHGRDSWGSG
jgi:hypothetical protein